MANTSLPNLTERTATASSDLIHVNSGGTDYKETKANFLSDVNSSITSLNNSLTNITKLLWTNENPSSSFASQTVGISGTGFSYFIVVFRRAASYSQVVSAIGFPGINTASAFPYDGNINYCHARNYTINTTSVTFEDGYMNGNVDNSRMIPYKIYGCK